MITAKMNKVIFEEGDIDVSVESHEKSHLINTNSKPRATKNQTSITKFFKAPVARQNGAVPRSFNKQSTITSWLKQTPKATSESNSLITID